MSEATTFPGLSAVWSDIPVTGTSRNIVGYDVPGTGNIIGYNISRAGNVVAYDIPRGSSPGTVVAYCQGLSTQDTIRRFLVLALRTLYP